MKIWRAKSTPIIVDGEDEAFHQYLLALSYLHGAHKDAVVALSEDTEKLFALKATLETTPARGAELFY